MRITIVALLLTAALAGCSTIGSTQSQSAGAHRPSNERIVVDTDKMARVDKAARETGITVHWINPPVKRAR